MRQFGHNDVEIGEEKTAWSGFWKLKLFRLRHRRFAGGWSETLTRELHCRGEAVGVLLYDPTLDAIGMVEQFRIGAAFRAGSPWLLELGAGFNPELTGRENVRLNAPLLGLSSAEIEQRLPGIVEFADIGDFVDQPVRSY